MELFNLATDWTTRLGACKLWDQIRSVLLNKSAASMFLHWVCCSDRWKTAQFKCIMNSIILPLLTFILKHFFVEITHFPRLFPVAMHLFVGAYCSCWSNWLNHSYHFKLSFSKICVFHIDQKQYFLTFFFAVLTWS